MIKRKIPDWLTRALKTFVQAFISFIVADLAIIGEALTEWQTSKHVIVSVLVGALAAAVSAAWNIVIEVIDAGKEIG